MVLRKRRKYRGFPCFYQEPRQLQIQSCSLKTDCLDRDDDAEDDDDDDDDDDSDSDDHDVDAPDYDDVGKYDASGLRKSE